MKHTGRHIWGRAVLAVAAASIVVVGVLPSPYVIESPGPVFDTLGTTSVSGGGKTDVIQIKGATTYPTTGRLDMLTVAVLGTPDAQPNWFQVVGAWANSQQAVTPMQYVYAPGTTTKQDAAENTAMMNSSQEQAVVAALKSLNYPVTEYLKVASLTSKSHARGQLRQGDRLVSVDGAAAADIKVVQKATRAAGAKGAAVTLVVERGGQQHTFAVKPYRADGTWLLGITFEQGVDAPISVSVHLDNVGGPSAGMMFALAIRDKLTSGSMTGGQHIAGTGTMSGSGTVGAIGGIRQKMISARAAGARWFLAPASNCSEVVGHVPAGLQVISVKTLSNATKALDTIATTKTAAGLPTCS